MEPDSRNTGNSKLLTVAEFPADVCANINARLQKKNLLASFNRFIVLGCFFYLILKLGFVLSVNKHNNSGKKVTEKDANNSQYRLIINRIKRAGYTGNNNKSWKLTVNKQVNRNGYIGIYEDGIDTDK